ncbi:hypothetical protein PPH94_020460 [Burkholderia cepacia]|uniref:hypothetical protein n=1 Tax=Burkholderia cepacia TaxID=292 RepID=UPI000A5DE692|nr:hypothetical protein [Burkholderia cepacia]MDC6104355.1 hypothetical protein [Burkholderia cepacia]
MARDLRAAAPGIGKAGKKEKEDAVQHRACDPPGFNRRESSAVPDACSPATRQQGNLESRLQNTAAK